MDKQLIRKSQLCFPKLKGLCADVYRYDNDDSIVKLRLLSFTPENAFDRLFDFGHILFYMNDSQSTKRILFSKKLRKEANSDVIKLIKLLEERYHNHH